MIIFKYENVKAIILEDGSLLSISFDLIGTTDTMIETCHWNTPSSLPPQDEPYSDEDLMTLAKDIAKKQNLEQLVADKIEYRETHPNAPVNTPPHEMTESEKRGAWMTQVDNTIAGIQNEYTRFQMAYVEREAAARAYIAAGYEGDASIWLTRFGDNVGMPYNEVADLVVYQADNLRAGLKDLDNLRMDKYLIARAPTISDAENELNKIIAEAFRIGATLV